MAKIYSLGCFQLRCLAGERRQNYTLLFSVIFGSFCNSEESERVLKSCTVAEQNGELAGNSVIFEF